MAWARPALPRAVYIRKWPTAERRPIGIKRATTASNIYTAPAAVNRAIPYLAFSLNAPTIKLRMWPMKIITRAAM
ncbi:hypothetical protein CGL52_11835 [Pyrobaculum aerophilum]|uniref:Uncharacterized protein n=1 Tax=Pyrobaculum aerophilum TaxID=13773 RepID=A0A371QZC5_9CREN|nr:hypothetical protein CGL52_11835 [Pyrobaculum aerophilum]